MSERSKNTNRKRVSDPCSEGWRLGLTVRTTSTMTNTARDAADAGVGERGDTYEAEGLSVAGHDWYM